MTRLPIPINDFAVRTHHIWDEQWLLLTAGDFAAGQFNAMTVGWGSFGTMWGRPFAQIVVRPTRYTYEFNEKHDTFTLCAFGDEHHDDLLHLGTVSGRHGDKIAQTPLTPEAASVVAAPAFREAELIVECRKIYWDDFDPGQFLDPKLDDNYSENDYHRIYYGEIVAVTGTDAYRNKTG